MSKQTSEEKIVVIYDTFCGWCYGAAPVFDAIVETGTDVEVLHGHIFNGHNSPKMSEGKGAQILETIPHIEALTGQVFSDAFKTQIAKRTAPQSSSTLPGKSCFHSCDLLYYNIILKNKRDFDSQSYTFLILFYFQACTSLVFFSMSCPASSNEGFRRGSIPIVRQGGVVVWEREQLLANNRQLLQLTNLPTI